MKNIKIFINLTRLNKPIGFMLLFWPSIWGLTLGFNKTNNITLYFFYTVLFFLGSVLMRSAGCIVNDIADKDFDKKTERTKNRPIASGKISIFKSLVYTIVLCLLAFIILLQFNKLTFILGLISIPLAFLYPFVKRYTYWPQFFLGITFNWGVVMGWASMTNNLSVEPIILYLSAIFWTLGYDTIYGYQDIEDDEIIGVKSTSIKFKKNYRSFIGSCYFISILFLIYLGIKDNININYFIFLIFPILQMIFQIMKINIKDAQNCLYLFRSNNFFGFLIFIGLLSSGI